MFLRPRKFGKTLFTSTLENYYDVRKADKFEKLYGNTYIGKNPTKLKNSYHILKFNFSGMSTDTPESTIKGFKKEVESSINVFAKKYNLEFYINSDDEAENILDNLFKAFELQKPEEKIYVIIDEYDHFANELLGEIFEKPILKIPNQVMKEIYSEYFLQILSRNADLRVTENDYNEMLREIALEGKID